MAQARADAPAGIEARLLQATLACVARHGLAKTTLDDVAREAGCARATLYRYFSGKRQLVRAVVAAEGVRIADAVRGAARNAENLEDAAVALVSAAARELRDHRALQFVFAFESEVVLPYVTFEAGDRFLAAAAHAVAPALERFLPPERVVRAAEWLARVSLAYLCSPTAPVDLTDEPATRRLLHEFVLPGLADNTVLPTATAPRG
jgi:AcrR family transcriptional regulator